MRKRETHTFVCEPMSHRYLVWTRVYRAVIRDYSYREGEKQNKHISHMQNVKHKHIEKIKAMLRTEMCEDKYCKVYWVK